MMVGDLSIPEPISADVEVENAQMPKLKKARLNKGRASVRLEE